MRAIETTYNEHRFRSRLEARWAVFFDALEIKWQYELEGYDLGALGRYLPDFWLPDLLVFAEVKANELTAHESNLCRLLAKQSKRLVVMAVGVPMAKAYCAEQPNGLLTEYEWSTDAGVLYPAATRATSARFEHGETPSSFGMSPSERVRRGERTERHKELEPMDARDAELDRLIPLADGEERDNLIAEKKAIRQLMAASGRRYYKTFRRTR